MAIGAVVESSVISEWPEYLGPYRVINRIAEGGTANVFRGQHCETGRVVALKTVRTGLPHEVAVLAHEIATLRALRHPGIVRFVDTGARAGLPWMAEELLEGRTLFQVLGGIWQEEDHRRHEAGWGRTRPGGDNADEVAHSPLDSAPTGGNWVFSLQDDPFLAFPSRRAAAGHVEDALVVVVRLIHALEYIHSRGVVHADLKPPNILLGDDGRVTLVDFGAAHRPRKRRGGMGGSGGVRLGTMEYAAPEQILGDALDVATDVYSLGCILYEIVTGRIPFEGESRGEIARKHLDDDAVCPSQLVSGLSSELEDLIMEMLAKQPNQRPRSARAVAGRIARVLPRCQQMMLHG